MLSISKNVHIAFPKIIEIIRVNRFVNQFLLTSVLPKVIFWLTAIFNERV